MNIIHSFRISWIQIEDLENPDTEFSGITFFLNLVHATLILNQGTNIDNFCSKLINSYVTMLILC